MTAWIMAVWLYDTGCPHPCVQAVHGGTRGYLAGQGTFPGDDSTSTDYADAVVVLRAVSGDTASHESLGCKPLACMVKRVRPK